MGYNLRDLLNKSDYVIVDALKGKCATCEHYSMDYSDINGEKEGAHCRYYNTTRFDDSCSRYDKTYKSDKDIIEGLERIKRKSYYVLTTVCDLLNLPKDNKYRQAYNFMDEAIVSGTVDGDQLLEEYDYYGKEIRNTMLAWNNNEYLNDLVMSIINKEIIPVFDKIVVDVDNGNYRNAILRYVVLIRRLMERFDIRYEPRKLKKGKGEHTPAYGMMLALKRSK